WVSVVTVIIFAAALRLHQLDSRSIWLDEGISVWAARLPWDRLLPTLASHDESPPLYFAILHLWLIAGDGERWIRLLSVTVSLAAVGLAYGVGAMLGGRNAGVLASIVMAVSRMQIYHAQEARMYALVAALSLGTTYAALQTLRYRGWRWPVIMGICSAFLASTHHTAALLPVGIFAGTAIFALTQRSWKLLRYVCFAGIIASVLWAPVAPVLLTQARLVSEHYWIPPVDHESVQRVLLEASVGLPPPARHIQVSDPLSVRSASDVIALLLALPRLEPLSSISRAIVRAELQLVVSLLTALLFALAAIRIRAGGGATLVIAGALIVPVAVILAVSTARPLLLPRALVGSGTLSLVLLAVACTAIPRPFRFISIGILLLFQILTLGQHWWYPTLEDWRGVATYLAKESRSGDLVLIAGRWTQLPLDYYLRRYQGVQLEKRGIPVDLSERGKPEPVISEADIPRMRSLVSGRDHIWLVLSHTFDTDPRGLTRQTMEEEFGCYEVRSFHGIQLLHFERCRPAT
ncbi:MAG TPA: glycosyltransferase family 39 protein, partial [Chloroflexota bacterium]|nr:glycosyltransferase family 39 protein [Chloroflexota bacterium]